MTITKTGTNGNPTSKSATVLKLLRRDKGATIAEIVKTTGWKEHSCRAFLTGVRKRSLVLKEQRSDGQTAYRVEKTTDTAAKSTSTVAEVAA